MTTHPTPGGDLLMEVRGLDVDYLTPYGATRACREVDLTVRRGEIVGLAGESASGKSTLLNALTRLQRPPAITRAGSIVYHRRDGSSYDLVDLTEKELAKLRWNDISVVMQSAMACLNPVMRLGAQFVDVLRRVHPELSAAQAMARAGELLEDVGIPADRARSYPHEMSGGMRQRSLIALALACDPELVVMDEPTTAVDVVMQRMILTQILRLQQRYGFSVVYVTHDLAMLLEICDRIAIMYAGRIVETADAVAVRTHPTHPYTAGLRDSFPSLADAGRELRGIPGSPPSLDDLPPGCEFAPRCAHVGERCRQERPVLETHGTALAACWYPLHQQAGAGCGRGEGLLPGAL